MVRIHGELLFQVDSDANSEIQRLFREDDKHMMHLKYCLNELDKGRKQYDRYSKQRLTSLDRITFHAVK
jgi:uncharacterized coiled-coil DUF342 family protein